jgi:RimJ/RimL family protein N-acetyltransferase
MESCVGCHRLNRLRLGFEVEGRRRDALRVGGEHVDEYLMAKLLPESGA